MPGKPMRYSDRLPLLVAIISTVIAEASVAQLTSLPVYQRPVRQPWPTYFVSVDYGIGAKDLSSSSVLAARLSVEGDRLRGGVGAGIMMVEDADNELTIGGNLAYGLLDPNVNLIVVDVQAGLGTVGGDLSSAGAGSARRWDVPIGVAVGVAGFTPFDFLSMFEPWVSVRGHVRNSRFETLEESAMRGGYGLSAGLYLVFPGTPAIGLHGAFDWLRIRDPLVESWRHEIAWGFGGHIGL